jgi:hypothetical protein
MTAEVSYIHTHTQVHTYVHTYIKKVKSKGQDATSQIQGNPVNSITILHFLLQLSTFLPYCVLHPLLSPVLFFCLLHSQQTSVSLFTRSLSLSACFPAFCVILFWSFICYLNFFPPPSVCCPFFHSSYFSCSLLAPHSLLLFFLYLYYCLSSLPFLGYFHLFALYLVFITNFSPSLLVFFPSPVFNTSQESHISCTGWHCVCPIPPAERHVSY